MSDESTAFMDEFRIERFSLNKVGRDFAVGDIHGCFLALQSALLDIHFNPSVDRLFALGDLVDRGPQSDRVQEWMDKPWLHAVVGNHEHMAWRRAILGTEEAVALHNAYGGDWMNGLSRSESLEIARRLAALPIAIEVETHSGIVAMVHADCPFDDWVSLRALQGKRLADDSAIVRSCIWTPVRFQRHYFGIVRNVRAVLHGHVTVPTVNVLGNAFYIDCGGWLSGGRFALLNLHTLVPESGASVS